MVGANEVGEDRVVLLPDGSTAAHPAAEGERPLESIGGAVDRRPQGRRRGAAEGRELGSPAGTLEFRRPIATPRRLSDLHPFIRSILSRCHRTGCPRHWARSIRPIRGMRPTSSSGPWPRRRRPGPATFTSSPAATGWSCAGGSTGSCTRSRLLPAKVAPNVVARLKVLSELLTYRTDVPQEGRIKGVPGEVEMRVSTFPTLFGEKAVVRMFAGPGRFLRLGRPGLARRGRDELDQLARRDLGGDRPFRSGRQRQDDHDLRLPARAGGPLARRAQPGDPGRSHRGRRAGRRPGPGQPAGRADARVGLEVAVAARPRGHRHRRDPRQGHRRDRASRPPSPAT